MKFEKELMKERGSAMEIIETAIPEVKIVVPKVFGDARGYFFESWNAGKYAEAGIDCNWMQDNESRSKLGVLRDFIIRRRLIHRQSWCVLLKVPCLMWLWTSAKVPPPSVNTWLLN